MKLIELLKQADDLHKHRTVPPSKKEIHDLVTTAYEAGQVAAINRLEERLRGTAGSKSEIEGIF